MVTFLQPRDGPWTSKGVRLPLRSALALLPHAWRTTLRATKTLATTGELRHH